MLIDHSSSTTFLSTDASMINCFKVERDALLQFKAGLFHHDDDHRLSSWMRPNCCLWEGVECDNTTGHIISLDLHNPLIIDAFGYLSGPSNKAILGGEMNPLLALKHLVYLDLSGNNFNNKPIPRFMGSFQKLRYLNLSFAGFAGTIPTCLGNLTSLKVLDLSKSNDGNQNLQMGDTKWLSRLNALEYLDMSYVEFTTDNAFEWAHSLNSLASISTIRLVGCGLRAIPLVLRHLNFTSLSLLDLSWNMINSTLPTWLLSIKSVQHLDLSYNNFYGLVPESIGNMTSLQFLSLHSIKYPGFDLHMSHAIFKLKSLCKLQRLDLTNVKIEHRFSDLGMIFSGCFKNNLKELSLRSNALTGYLPDWIRNLTSLRLLDLSENSLYGRLPQSLGRLLALEELFLHENGFNGTITEAHFQNLTRLKILDISSTSLVFNVSANWVPPFQLEAINMKACPVGPTFPAWLRTQTTMVLLDLSRGGIIDTLPKWFWGIISNMIYLDLSRNGIQGKLPSSLEFASGKYLIRILPRYDGWIDLSSNYFEGTIPNYIQNIQWLDLSNNSFSGPLPLKINAMRKLYMINLSNNNINGTIPSTLCELENLSMLILSMNSLSKYIPDCWKHNSNLMELDFSFNHLSGPFPSSIFLLPQLTFLSLGNNNLSGYIPFSVMKCKNLYHLDLGYNRFTGNIPTSLGENISGLGNLILRSNNFYGNIPPQLSLLTILRVLDLSNNHLSGIVPRSFGNFSSMKSNVYHIYRIDNFATSMFLITKGLKLQYKGVLPSISIIDLSENDLYGDIPQEIWNLSQLNSLNLSGNHLTGEISDEIGSVRQLESLDLSRNELSGVIPGALLKLNFLSVLNLSHNHLSGEIPMGGQLSTFVDPSIYNGNDDLCGFPLSKKCIDSETKEQSLEDDDDIEINDTMWFYFGIMSGFVVGSWIVWIVFWLKKPWKIAYFLFVDRIVDALYVAFVVKCERIKRCMYAAADE